MYHSPVSLPRLSVDLVRAAHRNDEFPRVDEVRLLAAVERYLRFLVLCAEYPDRPLAPTRDIDRIWHLHMLNPRAYSHDCKVFFGDLLDHDGGFGVGDEEPDLMRIFGETAKLWETRFGEPYVGDPGIDIVKCTRNCVSRCQRACKT